MRWQVALAALVLLLALSGAMPEGSAGVSALFTDQAAVGGNAITTGAWSGGGSTTLSAVADTYLREGNANQNEGTSTPLHVQGTGSSNQRTIIQFDSAAMIGAIGSNSLTQAKLRLYSEDAGSWGSSGRYIDAHRLTVAWTELGATWNCPVDTDTANGNPDCAVPWGGGSYLAAVTASVLHLNSMDNVWVEYDVTADVAYFLSNPSENFGWLLLKQVETAGGNVDYTSREGGANGPQLVLTFQ